MISSRQTKFVPGKNFRKRILFPCLLRYGVGLSILFSIPAYAMTPSASRSSPARKMTQRPFSQKGLASWYSGKSRKIVHHTAQHKDNTEITNLTAAHPFLPFGTKLLVHSPQTGRSVIVVVNDRGPFIGKRIIDISKSAAAKLGILKSGVTQVVVTEYVQNRETQEPENHFS